MRGDAAILSAGRFYNCGKTMARRLRIARGRGIGRIPDSIESLEAYARVHGPGRYPVDEHSLRPFPGTKVSARASGKLVHHKDGQVLLDPVAWQA